MPGRLLFSLLPRGSAGRAAFTLIELLVVIAIISIIAAIIFPVFGAARESARKITCLNNVKQIGMAVLQYPQDHKPLCDLIARC